MSIGFVRDADLAVIDARLRDAIFSRTAHRDIVRIAYVRVGNGVTITKCTVLGNHNDRWYDNWGIGARQNRHWNHDATA